MLRMIAKSCVCSQEKKSGLEQLFLDKLAVVSKQAVNSLLLCWERGKKNPYFAVRLWGSDTTFQLSSRTTIHNILASETISPPSSSLLHIKIFANHFCFYLAFCQPAPMAYIMEQRL